LIVGLPPYGGGNGANQNSNSNSTAPAIGASLGLLALVGLLGVLFAFWKRRKSVEEVVDPMTELSEDGTDSSFDGDEDLFVSEYGFSDKHLSDHDENEDEDKAASAAFSGEGQEDDLVADVDEDFLDAAGHESEGGGISEGLNE
jgi:hypothetical protein